MLVMCAFAGAKAQVAGHTNAQVAPDAAHLQQVPKVPGVSTLWRGLNAGVTFSGVHDSSIGWSTVATPAVSYTFSPHYSADVSISIFPSRMVEKQIPGPQGRRRLVIDVGELGDTFIGLHASFNPRLLRNTTTASFTIPTGDKADGLGAGKVTFDFSDHMEHYYKQTGFLLDFGAGNSSGLFNRLVTNNYTSVGTLTHFQQGAIFWLRGHNYVQSVAYEQFPIGSQTLYTNPGPPGAPTNTVVSGTSIGRALGVTTAVGTPLSSHMLLSCYYSRSFKQPLDTVSVGMTYVFRGIPGMGRLSMIDKALREAETGGQQETPEAQPKQQ